MAQPRQNWAQRLMRRFFGVSRVACYLTAVCALLAILGTRSAQGRVGEAALVVGRQLAGFEDLTEGSYRVMLNGETVMFSTKVVDLPMEEVLDRFEAHCDAGSVLPRELTDQAPFIDGSLDTLTRSGVLRRDATMEGMVACLVNDEQRSFLERWQRFSETLDLADVGRLRYVYAKRTPGSRTHVVVAWTEDRFRFGALMEGVDKDAPGSDPEPGLRPAQSVRMLTADVEGAPASVRVYRSAATPETVFSQAERDFIARGFTAVEGVAEAAAEARVYTKQNVDTWVIAHADGDGSVVSVLSGRAHRLR